MSSITGAQYFSNLNGLSLGNNVGDMINLLDICLVNGKPLPAILSAEIQGSGDLHLTFASNHNTMLFQYVQLDGFNHIAINKSYRVMGVPTSTELILKADLSAYTLVATGTAKIAPLGYETIYSDTLKRVYRAKNPDSIHPYIRVDENISSADGSYTSTYAKYAMIGLLEDMEHIDDYMNPTKLQLPMDPADLSKNWKISGTGTSVTRGWAKLYWAVYHMNAAISNPPGNAYRKFTLCGDKDIFYILVGTVNTDNSRKYLYGAGIYDSVLDTGVIPPWCLLTPINSVQASQIDTPGKGKYPILYGDTERKFAVLDYDEINPYKTYVYCDPILPNNYTGMAAASFTGSTIGALQIPIADESKRLRGTLKHVCYAGTNLLSVTQTTPMLGGNSMYVAELSLSFGNNTGALLFYLGELE